MTEHESYLARRWRPERLELAARAAELLDDALSQAAHFGRLHEAGQLGDVTYRHLLAGLNADVRLAQRVLDCWQRNTLPPVEAVVELLNVTFGPET